MRGPNPPAEFNTSFSPTTARCFCAWTDLLGSRIFISWFGNWLASRLPNSAYKNNQTISLISLLLSWKLHLRLWSSLRYLRSEKFCDVGKPVHEYRSMSHRQVMGNVRAKWSKPQIFWKKLMGGPNPQRNLTHPFPQRLHVVSVPGPIC